MTVRHFHKDEAAQERVSAQLLAASRADSRFRVLVVFSCCIATLGLIVDSPAVVIGAMLVAPLLTPMMSVAVAALGGRPRMLEPAALAIIEAIVVAVALSALIATFARHLPFDALTSLPHEAQVRTRPNPFDLGIALCGGAVGAYALTRLPGSDALPGVAIATALMPPLCTIGIGLALNDRGIWGGAALLFLTNLSAIVFAAMVVFLSLGFRPATTRGDWRPVAALSVVVIVGATLVALTLRTVEESRDAQQIRSATEQAVKDQLPRGQLITVDHSRGGGVLHISVTARTVGEVGLADVERIQSQVAQRLQERVALVFTSVPAVILDPLNPPSRAATITPVVAKPTPTPPTPGLVIPGLARD